MKTNSKIDFLLIDSLYVTIVFILFLVVFFYKTNKHALIKNNPINSGSKDINAYKKKFPLDLTQCLKSNGPKKNYGAVDKKDRSVFKGFEHHGL